MLESIKFTNNLTKTKKNKPRTTWIYWHLIISMQRNYQHWT